MSVLLALILVVTVAITMETVVVTTVHVPRGTLWILMGTALVKNNYNNYMLYLLNTNKIELIILWFMFFLFIKV